MSAVLDKPTAQTASAPLAANEARAVAELSTLR